MTTGQHTKHTPDQVAGLLARLAGQRCDDRDQWVKVGMAVRSELGDAGFSLWDSWSRKSTSYNERSAKTTWNSIKPGGGITLGTLVQWANEDDPAGASTTPAASTKRAYDGLDDYATAHGMTGAQLAAWGWREVRHQGRPALAYSTTNGTRYRFLDGAEPRYIHDAGYKACWYGLDTALELARAGGQPLVLCNGEASTIAGQVRGVAAAAVTSGEKPRIPDDLLTLLQNAYSGPILVAYDCDPAGRKAAGGVVEQLRGAGFEARALDLGGHNGYDLADFCRLYDDQSAVNLPGLPDLVTEPAQQPLPAPAPRFQLVPAKDLYKLPPVSWLIPGQIPAGGLTVLYGPSGAGKSFVSLNYALALAQQHTVVYVAGEGAGGYQARQRAWTLYHGKDEGRLQFILNPVNLLDSAAVAEFISAISPAAPKLVILDTLARCLVGGDENSARDMGIFVEACGRIQQATGAAVLVVHHTGKNGGSERGSSALRGACDSMLELDNDDGLITLTCSKSKDSRPFEPHYYRLHEVDTGLRDEAGQPITSCTITPTTKRAGAGSNKLTQQQRKVLEALNMTIFTTAGASANALLEYTGIRRSTLYDILNRLVDRGLAEQAAKGDPFKITVEGREAIEMQYVVAGNSPEHLAHSNEQVQTVQTESKQSKPDTPHNASPMSNQSRDPLGSGLDWTRNGEENEPGLFDETETTSSGAGQAAIQPAGYGASIDLTTALQKTPAARDIPGLSSAQCAFYDGARNCLRDGNTTRGRLWLDKVEAPAARAILEPLFEMAEQGGGYA